MVRCKISNTVNMCLSTIKPALHLQIATQENVLEVAIGSFTGEIEGINFRLNGLN